MTVPLVTRSDIKIDAAGLWWFQENHITNPEVLSYFKKGLRRDKDGYFIINEFGEKLEHSYIQEVHGFPLEVVSLTPGDDQASFGITLDSGEPISSPIESFRIFDENTISVLIQDRGVHARLTPLAMAGLVHYLEEEQDKYFLRLNGTSVPLARAELKSLHQLAESQA